MIQLGDYVRSTENTRVAYIVIGLHNNEARVRTLPEDANEGMEGGWRVLNENVYTCDLDILEVAEA